MNGNRQFSLLMGWCAVILMISGAGKLLGWGTFLGRLALVLGLVLLIGAALMLIIRAINRRNQLMRWAGNMTIIGVVLIIVALILG